MTTVTDPARELAEIAERLTHSDNVAGEAFLANSFGVKVWSTDFVKIIACILERADLVAKVVKQSNTMDDDHKASALEDLSRFKDGCTGAALRVAWNDVRGGMILMKDHRRPLQYLSPIVRAEVRYPKLTEQEVAEFLELIDAYLEELKTSDQGPAFVRQAITDGLLAFRFQLEKIGWMGSGYALVAFREVMIVYEASKFQFSDTGNVDSSAVLNPSYSRGWLRRVGGSGISL
ncbi:hypothetical protein [Croceicoccus sp. YJ47]|uniref:hypothetical protein n=1 Tax=Croceicoccus sp. YJ47 TaxID=2798724 RepID=UPI0019225F91|nr:hypothetical protein [Croceicoccus sp. YJ47]QQN73887.1 hypothetical protein JD971_14230 [Croceicoccus sp. YJ47]